MKRALLSLLFPLLLLCGCASGSPPAQEPPPVPEAASPSPVPTPAPTPVPPARQLTLTVSRDGRVLEALTDEDDQTIARFQPGQEIRIQAEEAMDCLCIRWNKTPSPWRLEAAGQSVSGGEQEFLHEFIRLPVPSADCRICLSEEAAGEISGIAAFTPGQLPDWVQIWSPPWDRAELLLFPTHSDDEFVFFGGLIPLYAAERGLRVQVVYMTSNYGSYSWHHRCHEKLDGLWHAGIRNYPVSNPVKDLPFKNRWIAAAYYGEDSFIQFQAEQIRRFRPLVIVDHAERGEYGHSVHIFNTLSMEQAVSLAADPAYDPESAETWGVWDTPKLYLHLYGEEETQTVLDFEFPLAAFGGKSAFTVAQEAFALHKSQQQWGFRVYGDDSEHDCHRYGLFRSLVGEDTEKNDLFEHLTLPASADPFN